MNLTVHNWKRGLSLLAAGLSAAISLFMGAGPEARYEPESAAKSAATAIPEAGPTRSPNLLAGRSPAPIHQRGPGQDLIPVPAGGPIPGEGGETDPFPAPGPAFAPGLIGMDRTGEHQDPSNGFASLAGQHAPSQQDGKPAASSPDSRPAPDPDMPPDRPAQEPGAAIVHNPSTGDAPPDDGVGAPESDPDTQSPSIEDDPDFARFFDAPQPDGGATPEGGSQPATATEPPVLPGGPPPLFGHNPEQGGLFDNLRALDVVSRHGRPWPPVGRHMVNLGSSVEVHVPSPHYETGGISHTCTGWLGGGDVPAAGAESSCEFIVSQDSAITWLWNTNYWLDIGVSGGGSVDHAAAWHPAGTRLTVSAKAAAGHRFVGWSGDVNSAANPLSLSITRPFAITAMFQPDSGSGNEPPDPATNTTDILVSHPIETDSLWRCSAVYRVTRPVAVINGATLVIEAGTLVRFETGAALIISRGARIVANGTAQAPIVMTDILDDHFTGPCPVAGTPPYSAKNNGVSGAWGGLALLGKAFVATDSGGPATPSPDPSLEMNLPGFGAGAVYGGGDDDDSSGELSFVTIRYGGLGADGVSAVAGLTLAGVGRATTVRNVEVFQCAGNGFEFRGGATDTKYLQAWTAGGNSFDWDEGYRGRGQFWFGVKGILRKASGHVRSGKAIEMDGADGDDALLSSCPTIHNVTLVGHGTESADQTDLCLHFRDGSGGRFRNLLAMDFAGAVALVEGSVSNNVYDAADNVHFDYFADELYTQPLRFSKILELRDCLFWNCGSPCAKGLEPGGQATAWGADYEDDGKAHYGLETGFNILAARYGNCHMTAAAAPASPVAGLRRSTEPVTVGSLINRPVEYIDPRLRRVTAGHSTIPPPADGFWSPVTFQGAFHIHNWAAWTCAAKQGMMPGGDSYGTYEDSPVITATRQPDDTVSISIEPGVHRGYPVEYCFAIREPRSGLYWFYDMDDGNWVWNSSRFKTMPIECVTDFTILDAATAPPGAVFVGILDYEPNGRIDNVQACAVELRL